MSYRYDSREIAKLARKYVAEMLSVSDGGHYGGSLSVIDALSVVYAQILRNALSDKVILSKGHAAPALYSVLMATNLIDCNLITTYGEHGSLLQGHPDMTSHSAIDFSTGSLGQGISVALGLVLGRPKDDGGVWVFLGDGECQEGQVWEAAMLVARRRAARVHVIVDANNYQEWGFRDGGCPEPPVPDLLGKFQAFGWQVLEVNGHDHAALSEAVKTAYDETAVPTAIIARTIKGYGSALIESDPDRFHCGELTEDEQAKLFREFGINA